MPTGYTAKLMEKGETFEQFVLHCARAFGALIELRDEPSDGPIPEFKPSKYYAERVELAPKHLADLKALTLDERREMGEGLKADAIANSEAYIAKDVVENARLDAMAEQIQRWTPPSSDHEELKRFMLQQISVSRNNSNYSVKELDKHKQRTAMDFFNAELKAAAESVQYYQKQLDDEIKRVNERNEWVRKLRESISGSV